MSMRTAKDHDADDWVTMSFRVRHRHALLIHSAAEQSKEGYSTATHMRKLVLTWMADELGTPVPDYTSSELNQEDVRSVAANLGMSPREFMAHAARTLAASMMAAEAQPSPATAAPKRSISGLQRKAGAKRRPDIHERKAQRHPRGGVRHATKSTP